MARAHQAQVRIAGYLPNHTGIDLFVFVLLRCVALHQCYHYILGFDTLLEPLKDQGPKDPHSQPTPKANMGGSEIIQVRATRRSGEVIAEPDVLVLAAH